MSIIGAGQRFKEWRRKWRARGLAVDRLLPFAFKVPAPDRNALEKRVAQDVAVPGDQKWVLTRDCKKTVVESCDWVTGFVAERLPAQVSLADLKLPSAVSHLAVSGDEVGEYIGSFDVLLRVRACDRVQSGFWCRYDKEAMALDVKITGVSAKLGLHSEYMLRIFRHGQKVFKAAKKDKANPVGACKAIAYLLRRPHGQTFGGAAHGGAWSFLALDAEKFCQWDPTSTNAPELLTHTGDLVVAGKSEGELAQASAPLVARVARAAPRRDRWKELEESCARRGWVAVLDFVNRFDKFKAARPKDAAERSVKRLSSNGCVLRNDDERAGRGRPRKMAKLRDLRRLYPELA